jgi:hypothetical protein
MQTRQPQKLVADEAVPVQLRVPALLRFGGRMIAIEIDPELHAALVEITPTTMSVPALAEALLHRAVGDFWQTQAAGSGLPLHAFRARVREFLAAGETLTTACHKARLGDAVGKP